MKARVMFLTCILMLAPFVNLAEVAEATSGRALACSGTVCLNEALPNPTGYDNAAWPNGEWMEIYNSGNVPVDVLNWKLINKVSKTLDFDSTSIVGFEAGNSSTWTLQPGDYMVIARNGTPDSDFQMVNTFDYITMEDSSGNVIDQASWNSTSGSGIGSGISLEEDTAGPTNDWVSTNSPTPGTVNNAATAPVTSDLVISEVMANPWPTGDGDSWPGGEWFEIWNSGQSDIDLTGWSAVDAMGNNIPFNESHLVGSSMSITPDEYRIVAINSTNSNGVLNNNGESLRLIWPNGTEAQSISWSSTVGGFSLVEQGGNSWSHAAYPTPEMVNPMPWDVIVAGPSLIKITEVLPNSTIDGAPLPDGEWLELHNTGSQDIDLINWEIMDGMGNITRIDMSNLEANISQPGTMISADGRRLVQFTDQTHLWNNYNHLMLMDQFGTIVHKAWWTNDPGLDISLIEPQDPLLPWVPASWATPGQPEPGVTTVIGDIEFNEIFANAVGNDTANWPDGEWVELINNGNQSIDIANWHFTSGSRNFNINAHQLPLKIDTIIHPGEVSLVAINGSQGFYLKNSNSDTIELRDSTNQIISTITYDSPTEGESHWFWNGNWSQAPWITPGLDNPQTSPYTGSHTIEVTEILAHCSDGSITPSDDWVEVLNNGDEMIDLSAWRMLSDDGDLFHMRTDRLWNSSTMIIAPGERVVFSTPNWFISGLGGSLTIEDPDGVLVDFVSWTITTDCKTMSGLGEALPWPTPGQPEPETTSSVGPEDLLFSRFMFEEKSSTTNDEFFEISNIGDISASLTGWAIRKTTTGGLSFNSSFTSGSISAGSSVIISPDASSVKAMGATIILEADEVMDNPVWMPNSGATIQLISPDGTIADTFVYGNGPTSEGGWSGPSIGVPVTTVDRILYLRGDGCGDMLDTDSANDWEMRWSVAGASHFCGVNTFSDDTSVIPLIGPDSGLDEVMTMLNEATDSIHLHVYQFHHTNLAMALIDAQNRGVDVTVVIHQPESWWDAYTVGQSLGIAWELESYGIDVLQFSSSSSSPYQYIHSKVAVVDSQKVWISSGNWKESSLPSDGDGNRDWGAIVDSTDLATIVLERMAFDEDASQLHVEDATYPAPDNGTYDPPVLYTPSSTVAAITGPINGELLTCPDDCMQGLSDFIDSADSEILLSLQYFEMDWYWGWQENPLLDSLEDAAARGVSIRLAINQHYVDENPGIREAVNELNDWDGDVEAILMSENETVKKLHNKGVIIDGESVLISSINWGDNSILRNREMGLIIHSQEVTAPFEASFWEDWNRLDLTTDTDIDGIPDFWEVANNISRTNQDATLDPDNDGLTNIGEFSYGSNPHSNDTDGDCIEDGNEILWAATMPNVSAGDALTLSDADGDGVDDYTVIGCIPENTGGSGEGNGDGESDGESTDLDSDGVDDLLDDCPGTEPDTATDTQGCSSEQNKNLTINNSGEQGSSSGMTFMLVLITMGLIVLLGAGTILLTRKKNESSDDLGIISPDISEVKAWDTPILDGTSPVGGDTDADMSKFPGWSPEQVQNYLDTGWSEEQLAEWYKQQIDDNSA
jgi:phosphatidylserine/phosphatidylglycerophosphate/cardiolipin synthase-like enzyme